MSFFHPERPLISCFSSPVTYPAPRVCDRSQKPTGPTGHCRPRAVDSVKKKAPPTFPDQSITPARAPSFTRIDPWARSPHIALALSFWTRA
ncbi:hypothetical protein BGY98DRAFT_230464 [Russula aff. rugulosa BPL654]|nr:hypothetical protein BGY98DRAFT_230464 [Russula aff. rugulosa BPL654]